MKALPVIIGAGALVVIVRLSLRRRGRGQSSPIGQLAARFRGRGLLGDIGLVAGREVRERLRGRVFRVVTVVLFGVVAAAVVIPTIHTGTTTSQRVGVVASSLSLRAELQAQAKSVGLSVQLVNEPDLAQARTALGAGQLDMVVDDPGAILVSEPISDTDTSAVARYVRTVSETLGVQHAFAQAGLTPGQVAIVATAKPLPVESIHPGKKTRDTSEATALIGVILIFIVLTQYLTWTLMGVMEEKASRVVEVLLATVRPIQLLAGKVIGIGVVAMAQAVALVAFALILAKAVGSSLGQGAAPIVLASHACLAGPRLRVLQLDVRRGRLACRASGPSAESGASTERASDLRLHRLAHRSQLRQCLASGEGAGLSAPHRPVCHAHLGRVRGGDLVAVPALGDG